MALWKTDEQLDEMPVWLAELLKTVLIDFQQPTTIDLIIGYDSGSGVVWFSESGETGRAGFGVSGTRTRLADTAETVEVAYWLQEQFFPETRGAWGQPALRNARPAPRHHLPGGRSPFPPRLTVPDLASVRLLSERAAGDRHAVAFTVDHGTGERYRMIRELVRDLADDSGWRTYSGREGPDRVIAGKPDPFVGFYAYANGHFFAGGRVQSPSTDPARIRLVWDDGYALEDDIQNQIALLFDTRDTLELATAEFLDAAGQVIGSHATLIDD